MPQLDLLVSPPGTGKTTFCIDRFREEIQKSRSGIDSRSFFVLPNREHAGRIQSLLLKKNVAGFFNAHVLTLNDLAARFSESSGLRRPSEALRAAVVRELLDDASRKGELSYFGAVADAKGFSRALAAFFGEMRQGLVTVERFEALCQPLVSDPVFRLKYRDLTILARRYEESMRARGCAEPEESFSRLGAVQADLVIFDGFYRFTRAQLALIEAVARGSRRVIATLTGPQDPADRAGVFAHALQTRRELETLGFRAQPGPFAAAHRAEAPALGRLPQALFAPEAGRTPAGGAVTLLEAPNAREEMRGVAREIRRLYRTSTLHWSDCAVILRAIEPYRKVLESAFAEFDVPVHVHERRKLIEQGLAQTAARLLKLVRDDWQEPDAAFVLRSSCRLSGGPEAAEPRAQAALELVRAARAAGIASGREAWETLASSLAAGGARVELERLLEEERRLRTAKDAAELSRRLRSWLRSTPGASDDALTASALEELFETFGSAPVGPFSIVRAAEQLIDAIEAGLYSEKPRGRNRVQVYDVVMALPKEYKAVFVSGLAEKSFPRETLEEPVLKDAERRVLNAAAGCPVFEERSTRLSGERYFFLMAVTRARQRLTLTYPSAGLDGRPVMRSIFVDDVARCFDGLGVRRAAQETGPEHWEGGREASIGLLTAGFGGGLDGDQRERFRAWMARPEFRLAVETGLRGDGAFLAEEAHRRLLASDARPLSPSSLEALAACRFKYFSAKLLRLESRPEDREAAEQGTVFHDTLQKFFESLSEAERRDPASWTDASLLAARLEPFLEKEFGANAYFKRLPAYRRRVLFEQMRRALGRFALEEVLLRAERPYFPAYFEMKFGYDRPVRIGSLPVLGRIDRIDLSADGKTAIVVDYKSSKTHFVRRLAKGLELQMPVYWLAAEQQLGLRVAGVEHRHLKDGEKREKLGREEYRALFGKSVRPEADIRAMLDRACRDAEESAAAVRSADIAVRPKTCDHCDYSPVCRFEKWRLIYEHPLD